MRMKIETLWQELAATAGINEGWWLRLAQPTNTCPLYAAINGLTRTRAVLLRMPFGDIPPRRRWPRCRGLDSFAIEIDGAAHFGVALKDPRFADVFTALAEDLVRRIATAPTIIEQSQAFLGQLARWQKFLAAPMQGLSDEAQRGLWGELHVLLELLLPAYGAKAILCWKGPTKAHQDFQFPSGALEVKTTLATQPQLVRIASERQLDVADWPALFLHVIALDAREGRAETLPDIVTSVRAVIGDNVAAREAFEDSLLAAGYLDSHAVNYLGCGYVVRSERSFKVKRGFPSIVEGELPRGIGGVTYGLDVEACARFAVNTATVVNALRKDINR